VGEPQAGPARAWLGGSAQSAWWVAKARKWQAQHFPGATAGRPRFSVPAPFRRVWQASCPRKMERLRKREGAAPPADSVPQAPRQKASSIARRRATTQTVSSLVYTWRNFFSRNGLPPVLLDRVQRIRCWELARSWPNDSKSRKLSPFPPRTKLRQAPTIWNFCFLLC